MVEIKVAIRMGPDQRQVLEEARASFQAAGQTAEDIVAGTTDDAIVPCGTCHACCHSPVEIRPDWGDNPDDYEHGIYVDTSAPNSMALFTLNMVGGACYALKNGRCSIWAKRPSICRSFDCRKIFLMYTKEERRELVAKKYFVRAIMDAGRNRADTLEGGQAIRAAARKIKFGARSLAFMEHRRGIGRKV